MQTPKCVFNLTVILQSNLITVIAFRAFTVYLNKPRHPRQKSNRSDAASSAMTGPTSSIYIKKQACNRVPKVTELPALIILT